MKISVNVLETGGFMPAITGMRLPTQSKNDSYVNKSNKFILGEKDAKLAKGLLNKEERIHWSEEDHTIFQGDTHGKFQRSIIVWLDITMPRYMWSEIDTYVIGVTPTSSTSTMYTLKKEAKDITADLFTDATPKWIVEQFAENIQQLIIQYGTLKAIPINVFKSILPEGWLQRRIKSFSYQSLRRLYLQRHNHRLPEWQYFIQAIETLPYKDELLFGITKGK